MRYSASRRVEAVMLALVLVGVTGFAFARMEPGDSRAIPYQGVLEQNGVAMNDTVTMRFGLFTASNADTACVLTNNCPLWSEEQTVDVTNGRFSVVLGDGSGATLNDTVMNQPSLFLAMAVQASGDQGFTALVGTQEIVPVPLAARAAAANNYTVSGTLTAGTVAATTLSATTATVPTLNVSNTGTFTGFALGNGGRLTQLQYGEEGDCSSVSTTAVTGGFRFLEPFSADFTVVATAGNKGTNGATCTGVRTTNQGNSGFEWQTVGGPCNCVSWIAIARN